jgi:hypothetical protein
MTRRHCRVRAQEAVRSGDGWLERVRLLLEARADPNLVVDSGRGSALRQLVTYKDSAEVRALLCCAVFPAIAACILARRAWTCC